MTQQDKKSVEKFRIESAYPAEKRYVVDFIAIVMFLGFCVAGLYLLNSIFAILFLSCALLSSILMFLVTYEKIFSKDEKFLTLKDKCRFEEFCKKFPKEYKRSVLGEVDFERTSIKDIDKINKEIDKINKENFK